MFRVLRIALFLAYLLTPSQFGVAGVYVTSEEEVLLGDPFPLPWSYDKVKYRISDLMMLDDRAQIPGKELPESSLRARLLKQVAKWEPLNAKGALSLRDHANLSACYIRLGRFEKARELLDQGLKQAKDDDPERFLLLANLASAYLDGNPEMLNRAILKQREALAAAPAKPPVAAWSQEQWDHYKITERYFLKILELRNAEFSRGRGAQWKTVDALFEKVRFVGPSGEYEAGKLSVENLHELPRDALPILVQLLYWNPNDSRLYWLYGELLNAEGQNNDAYRVMDELRGNRGLGMPDLIRHRQVLKEAFRVPKEDDAPPPPEEPKKADDKSSKGLPEWRTLFTGFLAGLLVAAFGCVQLYLWLRRRAPVTTVEPPRAPAAAVTAVRSDGIVSSDAGHVTSPRNNG